MGQTVVAVALPIALHQATLEPTVFALRDTSGVYKILWTLLAQVSTSMSCQITDI